MLSAISKWRSGGKIAAGILVHPAHVGPPPPPPSKFPPLFSPLTSILQWRTTWLPTQRGRPTLFFPLSVPKLHPHVPMAEGRSVWVACVLLLSAAATIGFFL